VMGKYTVPSVLLAEILARGKAEKGCRVAPAGHPAGALARSGQGDFHHPALPAARLAVLTPSAARLVRYLPELRGHEYQRRGVGHVSLREFVRPRAAFAQPGPGVPPFPGVAARMRPSDSPGGVGPGCGCPRRGPTPSRALF